MTDIKEIKEEDSGCVAGGRGVLEMEIQFKRYVRAGLKDAARDCYNRSIKNSDQILPQFKNNLKQLFKDTFNEELD